MLDIVIIIVIMCMLRLNWECCLKESWFSLLLKQIVVDQNHNKSKGLLQTAFLVKN